MLERYIKYVSVLESMKTSLDDSSIETLQDYTRVCSEIGVDFVISKIRCFHL